MATNSRLCVLEIINEVRQKLGVNTVSLLTQDKLSRTLLQFLNEIITECTDFGNWPQYYNEVSVPVSAAVKTYSLPVNFPIQNIHEVAFDDDPAALEYRDIEYMRVLGRAATNNGTPRQYTIKGTDAKGNPEFTVHPTPTTAAQTAGKVFDVALYKKPALITTNQIAHIPELPANLLIQGLFARALLDENAGEEDRTSTRNLELFYSLRQQALNRYTADTGGDVYFTPILSRR